MSIAKKAGINHLSTSLNRQCGLSIISMLITSLIVAIIIIKLVLVGKQDTLDVQVDSAEGFVTKLHLATIAYYDTHCGDPIFVTPTPAILVTEKVLGSINDILLYGSNTPVISIDGVGGEVKFKYLYTFTSPSLAHRAFSSSSYTTINGSVVTWSFANHSTSSDSLSYNQELLSAFGANYC